MKCPLCWKQVSNDLSKCPHCNFELPSTGTKDTSKKKLVSRKGLRLILYISAVGAISVGLMARGVEWGEHNKDRGDARGNVGRAIESLSKGDYQIARQQIDKAIAIDRDFAEAQLTRSMVYLANGDPLESDRSATLALSLFDRGKLDKDAWHDGPTPGSRDRGMLIAVRIQCLARAAGRAELTPEQSGRLFELSYEFSAAKNCISMKEVLERWKKEIKVVAVATQAGLNCPTLWNCPPKLPEQKKRSTQPGKPSSQ